MTNQWIIIIFVIMWTPTGCAGLNANRRTIESFIATKPVNNLLQFNGTYFIATTNHIHQVDAHLNFLQTLVIGPVNNEDNFVTLMLVDNKQNRTVLFWCGSVNYGLCHVNPISNLSWTDYFDVNYTTQRLGKTELFRTTANQNLLKTGAFGHIGSKAGAKAIAVDVGSSQFLSNQSHTGQVIFAVSTGDGRYRERSLPSFGFYYLSKVSNGASYYLHPFQFSPQNQQFSWIYIRGYMAARYYPVHHISILETDDYLYLVVVQKEQRNTTNYQSVHFHTRLARLNKTDIRFLEYIESPVECVSRSHSYNIAVDAQLARAGTDIATQFNISTNDKVIYFLQGESPAPTSYPTMNSAVVCALPLKTIDQHFKKSIRRCLKGSGTLVEWYYRYRKLCVATVSKFFNNLNSLKK